MLYVLNNKTNKNNFVDENKTVDEFGMELISEIRKDNSEQMLSVSFGWNNVHIVAHGTDFDTWIYNDKHPVFQRALKNSNIEMITINK
jgi:hypothetical protein